MVLHRGTEEPEAERMRLCAGPLSMVFEPGTAVLRYVRLGDHEILRGVYAAVRDRNWGTVSPKVSNLRVEDSNDAFRLTFDVECKEREIDFFWTGEVVGTASGRLTFSMEGAARSNFLRNRIGLCVLHPIRECKGRPCVVEHVDGAPERGSFPRLISPHQPFKEMRGISHEVVPGLSAEVHLMGEVFEMEDQRNWTDASYKTYGTPLELPFPVEVTKGAVVAQSVSLTLNGELPGSVPRTAGAEVAFVVGDAPPLRLPRIGLGAASHGRPLSKDELDRLRALNLAHLRVDLYPSEPGWARVLERAAAAGPGVALEVGLFLSDAAEGELNNLARELKRIVPPRVARWLIFRGGGMLAPQGLVRLARQLLSRYAPDAEFGTGTDAFFAELNRERLVAGFTGEADLVCYSVTPQVHASDDASMVETLQAQAETVESARRLAGDLPVVVTPVTLKPRFNPNATGSEPEPEPGELPQQVDPRQASLFAAAWTLGSIKYLSESAVHAATYYETTGWRGVMETENGTPLPERFNSIAGAVFPIYHVLADVGEFSGGGVISSRSSDPLRVDGMTMRKEGRSRTMLANLSSKSQAVRFDHPGPVERLRIKRLDASNAERAMRSPEAYRAEPGAPVQGSGGQLEFVLSPYSLARIDWDEVARG
jgi:D-apionolactonase